MSKKKRKITYWSFRFIDDHDNISFDAPLFTRFLDYLNSLETSSKILKGFYNKAALLSNADRLTIEDNTIYDVVFKSCKYNHSPDYLSSTTGEERRSDKRLDEGDKELTHLCMRILPEEAYTLLEERRSGITMNGILSYLNSLWEQFTRRAQLEVHLQLTASQILNEDFLASLRQTKSIGKISIFTSKTILGSDFLNLINLDHDAQEDIEFCIKSKRKRSLPKEPLVDLYAKISSGTTKAKRIHIQGKNYQDMNVIFDSMNIRRIDEITVSLLPNGIVDTISIFSAMHRIIMEEA